MLDEIDLALVRELRKNSKRKIHQLSKALGIPRSTVHNRIKKLEKEGIIKTYQAIVDHAKLGRPILAFIHIIITSKRSAEEIATRLREIHNVEEVHVVTGQYDIIVKARFKSTEELGEFIFSSNGGLRSWEGIDRTETMVVLSSTKEYGIKRATPRLKSGASYLSTQAP